MNKFSILIITLLSIYCQNINSKKAPYAGFGKISKTTGRIKTKNTRGYFKPKNCYKFVNPYSRS